MSGVQTLVVGPDEAEQRIDRWLRRRFPHLAQGRIEKMCRKGELRVDGGRVKSSTRVAPGQTVRIPPLPDPAPEAEKAGPPPPPPVSDEEAAAIRDAVLCRDDDIIVLNKPAGLAVQGGTGQRKHLGAFLEALRFGRPDVPRLVHRLDRDTSGILVLARTGRAASALTALFRTREVEKTYFALVAGCPSPPAGTIRLSLAKNAGNTRMEVVPPGAEKEVAGARHAVTEFRTIETAGKRASWVALRPVTGRTHQLRAHMAALGTPIVGDGKYAGMAQENRGDGWGASLGAALSKKLHLHAARLAFRHPTTGRWLDFAAPLPEHMARSWKFFGWSDGDCPEDIFGS